MKRTLLMLSCVAALITTTLDAQGQDWPRPEGKPWNLPDFLPSFDTCQLALTPIRVETSDQLQGYTVVGTNDWQTHALLIFMGVQARSYEVYAPERIRYSGSRSLLPVHRVFHFDDWAVHVVAFKVRDEMHVFGAILRDSAGFQASRELFSLLDSGGHEW